MTSYVRLNGRTFMPTTLILSLGASSMFRACFPFRSPHPSSPPPTPNYRRQQSFGSARGFPSNYMHQKNTECSFPCDNIAHKFDGTIATSLEVIFEENPCIQVAEALGVVSSALYMFSPCHDECIYNAQNFRSRAGGCSGTWLKWPMGKLITCLIPFPSQRPSICRFESKCCRSNPVRILQRREER